MNLDSTDAALVAAAHAGDHTALLALADKKREEGHDEFATLLEAGVNHGLVESNNLQNNNHKFLRKTFERSDVGEPSGAYSTKYHITLGGVHIYVPVHHPEYREAAVRFGDHLSSPTNSAYWQGTNPIWLTTPTELDALRAYSGDEPAKLPYEAVRHGRKGMAGVFKNEQGKYHLHVLNSWGLPYSGPVGPFPSLDHALREAEMHAGVEKEPVEETARQYQRAATTLAQQASK